MTNSECIIKNVQTIREIDSHKLFSDKFYENIVKNHLEILIFSMLSEDPMSGYGLIKKILAKYNVFLSQGTVYSLLYSMKDEGIIQAESMKGDMRTKRYSISQEGKHIIEKRMDKFIETEEHFLNSVKPRKSKKIPTV